MLLAKYISKVANFVTQSNNDLKMQIGNKRGPDEPFEPFMQKFTKEASVQQSDFFNLQPCANKETELSLINLPNPNMVVDAIRCNE